MQKNTPNTVVFVSFENHYAPWGGLAAVMKMLPPIMSKTIKTVLISPLFFNIPKTNTSIQENKLINTHLSSQVLYKGFKHRIELYKSVEFPESENYGLFLIKSDAFFLSGTNPYNDPWRFNPLIHDSYFLSKSVPVALNLIQDEFQPPYIINLQDWETALVVETMPPLMNHKCVVTLHNPYDEYLIEDPHGKTVMQLTLPKMQGVSTVSEQFANDLEHDVLLTQVICPKFQEHFVNSKPIGINNGNFVNLSFKSDLIDIKSIISEKLESRRAFNNILNHEALIHPEWGNKIDLEENEKPIFLLFGRDDPRQKGFDVAAAAVFRLLKKRGIGCADFIFTPIPNSNDLITLSYLEGLSKEFPNNVMVFPNRLSIGYDILQKAANFILMPSYYEPFGAANEGYAAGVPVIARATGGLIQQICPLNFNSLPEKIQENVRLYHKDLSKATGYLYREHISTETADNWRYLLSTNFSQRRSVQEPVSRLNPVFWSMVTELERTLEEALDLYYNDKKMYCQLILNGIELFKTFSWEKSAEKYRKELYLI